MAGNRLIDRTEVGPRGEAPMDADQPWYAWVCHAVTGERVIVFDGLAEDLGELIARSGHDVAALSVNDRAVTKARNELQAGKILPIKGLRFEQATPGQLPGQDGAFDSVVLAGALEYQARPADLIAEARRVLKEGGQLLVVAPFAADADPRQLHSFVITDLIELLETAFEVHEVGLRDLRICLQASATNAPPQTSFIERSAPDLLKLTEQAYRQSETESIQRQTRLRRRNEALPPPSTGAAEGESDPKQHLKRLSRQLKALEKRMQAMQSVMLAGARETKKLLRGDGMPFDTGPLMRRLQHGIERMQRRTAAPELLDLMPEIVGDLLRLTARYSHEMLGRDRWRRKHTPRPIFVCGTGRSGTTLLQQILSNHSRIFATRYEGRFVVTPGGLFDIRREILNLESLKRFRRSILGPWFKKVYRQGTPEEYAGGLFTDIDEKTLTEHVDGFEEELREGIDEAMHDMIDGVFASAMKAQGKSRWLEKTPRNVIYMNDLYRLFPDAQFVHIIRDGRDVAISCLENDFWPIGEIPDAGVSFREQPRTIENAARYWATLMQTARDQIAKIPDEAYLELRFEDLVDDPEGKLRQLCDFLGVTFEPQLLGTPLKRDRTRRWLSIFTEEDKASFKAHAGQALIDYGYEKDIAW